jgi:hypothetical protein
MTQSCQQLMQVDMMQVDKGFVAQIADVVGGRQVQLDARQLEEGDKAIPGETSDVPHVRGILSMAR